VVSLSFVLPRSRIHIRLPNSKITPYTRTNEMRQISMMNRYDVSLILTRSWKIWVPSCIIADLLTHVELRIIDSTFLYSSSNIIVTRTWNLSWINQICSIRIANRSLSLMIWSLQIWIIRIIWKWPHIFRSLHSNDIHFIPSRLVLIFFNFETWYCALSIQSVSSRAGVAIELLWLIYSSSKRATKDGLCLIHSIFHVSIT